MTDANAEEIVTFRLGPKDRAAIQRLVDEGEFRNRSDFLRYAVKTALKEHEHGPAIRAELDLDLEGYDIPTSAPAQRAKGRGRREVRNE